MLGGRTGEGDTYRGEGGVDPFVGYRGGIKTTDDGPSPAVETFEKHRKSHDGVISPDPLHRGMLGSMAYSPSKPEGSLMESLPGGVGQGEVASYPSCPRQRPIPRYTRGPRRLRSPSARQAMRMGSAAGHVRAQPPRS